MPIRVTTTPYGAAAFDALAAAVGDAKAEAGDPLAHVAVVVPTNTAGVMARRALGRRGGAAAIDVLTPFRVAELLASPSLLAEGRTPVSTPVVDLAVKQVLARSPGLYEHVDRHPSTIVALRDLYRDLRVAGPTALTALARTSRGNEPARVAAEVARRLARAWYDEGDLLARAADIAGDQLPDRFRRVVVHLPERLRPLEKALLAAVGANGSMQLVVGLTGEPAADRGPVRLAAELTGTDVPAHEHRPSRPPSVNVISPPSVDVLSTTDADDEVRLAVRAVLDAARAGLRFDRMAVIWPTARPYARLVEHQLGAAGVPWNGRPGTTTDERMVPRLLADLLELDRRGLRRSALMTLLGDVPARAADDRPVPTARWERMGRRAGIVREADWDARLPAVLAEAAGRGPAELAAAEALQAFVTELRDALGDPSHRRRWSDWVAWSHARLERWFGRRGLDRLEDAEREAWEQTQRVLDRLAHLDSIGPPVTRAEFRSTFVAELQVAPARHGKVGDGVHVRPLAGAGGLDVDLAVVVGAADGLLPPPPDVDPLLGDAERAAAGLTGSAERVEVAYRHFLAAVAGTERAVVTVPRGDLRVAATHHPSRWLETLAARGMLRSSTAMDSHAHALASTVFPVSPAEHRRRELWVMTRSGQDVRHHELARSDEALDRALRLRDARASDVLTEYDGDLSAQPIAPITAVSATRLELWASCPHAYFVQHVLGVRPLDEPDDIESVTPLDRGRALHVVLDELHRAVLAGNLPPPPPAGWIDDHRTALATIAARVADQLEAEGRTGRAAAWANERRALLAEVDEWLTADAAQWAGRTLRSSELEFGPEDDVGLVLPNGRTIVLSGSIDRVDQLADGSLVVTDHKTGRADAHLALTATDPTLGATRFQLPVYAAAARVLIGPRDATVRAEYSFFRRGQFRRIGYGFDDATWKQVGEDLAFVIDGIEAGFFPARPEPPAWRYYVPCRCCDPDGLGTAERWAEWDRKRHDPRLARWFADRDGGTS